MKRALAGIIILVPLLITGCTFLELIYGKGEAFDLIEADFVNPGQFARISKFRSCVGHGYPDEGGSSEKHYFEPDLAQYGDTNDTITVYAPFAGTVTKVEPEQHLLPKYGNEARGRQVHIKSGANSRYTAILFHVNQSSFIVAGAEVAAGQLIGYADCRYPADSENYSNFDIAIKHASGNYYSYFEMLPDDIFSAYQARTIQDREQLIFTKEEREAAPCDWDVTAPSSHWAELGAPQ